MKMNKRALEDNIREEYELKMATAIAESHNEADVKRIREME